MKLFIEYILDEIEQIGVEQSYRVSLSSIKNEDNYVRGVMQYFDNQFNIHLVIVFTYPEENPNLNYIFWILDHKGNDKIAEKGQIEDHMMEYVKDIALREVKVNLSKGGDIRNLFREIKLMAGSTSAKV